MFFFNGCKRFTKLLEGNFFYFLPLVTKLGNMQEIIDNFGDKLVLSGPLLQDLQQMGSRNLAGRGHASLFWQDTAQRHLLVSTQASTHGFTDLIFASSTISADASHTCMITPMCKLTGRTANPRKPAPPPSLVVNSSLTSLPPCPSLPTPFTCQITAMTGWRWKATQVTTTIVKMSHHDLHYSESLSRFPLSTCATTDY